MKKIITIFTLLLTVSLSYSQKGSIQGQITDNKNTELRDVNIIIKNTLLGTLTDSNGTFRINNIKKGSYILTISYLGFKTKEIQFSIQENEQINLKHIVLYEGNEILNEIVIKGNRANRFSRKETAYVSKLPLKDIENPQVYSTITTELIESQIITNFDDALKNTAGMQSLWTSTGRGGDGAGYYSLRGFSVQPQLVNGMPGLTNGTINAANIERIEVLKGPSATLFGSTVSSYGGLINVVTKKPYIGTGGQLSYTTGSFGLNQITGDFNTALNEEKTMYFRLNTSYFTEQSFQDAGFRKSFFVAPSLSYKVNNKLSFSFYGEITQAEQTNPTFLFLNRSAPTESKNLDELNYNNKLSFTSNDLTLLNPTQNYRVEMDYKITDAWKSQTIVSKSATSTSGYYHYLFDYGILGNDTFTRSINKQNSNTQTTDIQQNFIGDFKIASIRNRMVIGVDYFSTTVVDNSTGYAVYGNVTPEGNIVGPDRPLSTPAVDEALADKDVINSKAQNEVYSLYASDVLNFTNNFSAMVGVRLDRFENDGDITTSDDDYNQTTLSPKFGLIYQPIQGKLSVFTNYQNGFTNVAPQLVGDPNEGPQELKSFKPEQANQIEIGFKTNLFKNKLNATVSYYDIKVTDRVITDPDSPFNKIQGGEVISQGVELEINANPFKGLDIHAGFSNNYSETTKSDNTEILNRRPLEAGADMLYNFWANYEFQEGKLNGYGFGVGFNGASDAYAINYESTGEFILPAYTIANASVFYQADTYRIGLKLNNVFNKEYYKGWTTINPQTPRALLANFTYKF